MNTFSEKIKDAHDLYTLRSRLEWTDESTFKAGAVAALRLAAEEIAKDRITSGSIGPLMDAGFNLACKRWSEELRALASTIEGGT